MQPDARPRRPVIYTIMRDLDTCDLGAPAHDLTQPSGPSAKQPRPDVSSNKLSFQRGSRIFSPLGTSADGWYSVLWASQHPTTCDSSTRWLLVEDDLHAQGLGYTSEWLILALLYAARERRVMREVAVDPTWNPTCVPPVDRPTGRPSCWGHTCRRKAEEARKKRDGGAPAPPPPPVSRHPVGPLVCSTPTIRDWSCRRVSGPKDGKCIVANLSRSFHYTGHAPATKPRWCTRPPYTHECFYQRWSHCAVPPVSEHVAPRLGKGLDIRQNILHENLTRVMRIKLSWLLRSHSAGSHDPFYGDRKAAGDAAARFLFRPRSWVKRLAECVIKRAGGSPGSFLSVHLRDSVEKNR